MPKGIRMTQEGSTVPTGYLRTSEIESSIAYLGSVMSLLAKGQDTDGRFALIDYQTKPGHEPPPHVHDWEHELYYVLEGEMEFYCEDKMFVARPGDSVFLPAGKVHTFYVRSPFLRTLMLFVAAGERAVGTERFFLKMSEPVTSMELPNRPDTYHTLDPELIIREAGAFGVRMLSPEESAVALPHYPGFGAHLKAMAR